MTGAAVRVYGLYVGTVTGRTRARLETRLQIRNAGGMAKVTVTAMGDIHRRIGCRTWIVAIRTRAGQGDQVVCHMVDAAMSRQIGRMAILAVGRVSAGRDGGEDFTPGTVMTGRAIA